jgi:hypothetical protein
MLTGLVRSGLAMRYRMRICTVVPLSTTPPPIAARGFQPNSGNVFLSDSGVEWERKPGAGLGLAIVTEIMKAQHGGISVDDNPGGGIVF